MELSKGVEINIISVLNGQNLIASNGNLKNGYIPSKSIGEILADLARSLGYVDGNKVPCRIYIESRED